MSIAGSAAHGGEQDQRNDVGLGIVALPDLAVRVGAGRVEVAQRHVPDSVRRFGIPQHPLDHELGVAVRVDRVLRRILRQAASMPGTP